MTIESRISGVSDRAFNNALQAKFRDPRRSIRVLDFMTGREREILVHTSLGDPDYELFIEEVKGYLYELQWRGFDNV